MMDPDKELELLEQEYPRSIKVWVRDTPTELDNQILSIAARHAPYLSAVYDLKKEQKRLRLETGKDRFAPAKPPLTAPKNT